MRVLLVGPPGAGKGTQAARLAERLGVPHVASGNLLREAIARGTEVGQRARAWVERGDLVPDEVVTEVVAARLAEPDCTGFVLDGYPRTALQARTLDGILGAAGRPLHAVVLLEVDEEEVVRRLTGRRTCPACQRPYHLVYSPPRSDEVCDEDGARLVARADDTAETVRHRLGVYRREAEELVAHYERQGLLVRVDGQGSPDEVAERVEKALAGVPR